MRKILIASAAAFAGGIEQHARPAEIEALITTAMDAAVVVLIPQFEKASGHKVSFKLDDPSGGAARKAPRRQVHRA